MSCAKRIVLALGAFRKARQTAALTNCSDPTAPAGQNFVRISLVANIPNQPVAGRVEHIVKGNREFDNA